MSRYEEQHIRELAQRLAEAEATIAALLTGQVDAVVDSKSQTPVLLAVAQEALRASEERYRHIVETTNEGVWVLDAAQKTTFMNRRMAEMLGCEADLGLGRSPDDFLDEAGRARRALDFHTKGAHEVEVRFLRSDGTAIWTLVDAAPVHDSDGAYTGSVAMVKDITERKRNEADRLRLTERLSLATSVAQLGVWDWDLATDALTWDETMFRIYDVPATAPIQYRQWAAAVHPDDLAVARAALQAAIETKGKSASEFRIVRADGVVRLVAAVQRVVLDDQDKATRVVGVNFDVTERREAEAELRAARDAAEAANRAKSEFLANISHEIRTPMNGVIGMTDLVLDSQLTPEQRDSLTIVKSSADALLGILNDILDFSTIEAGRLALDIIDFSPRDVVGDTVQGLAGRAEQKGLELIVDIGQQVPQVVAGDPGRLRQVIVNLIGNAIKFTDRGEVLLRVIKEVETASAVVLHFSVRDSGIGIAADRQRSVFQAFTQVDGSVTRPYGGAGLGLAIASQLVRLIGGRLWMESEAGVGSTFHFTASFVRVGVRVADAVVDVRVLSGVAVLVTDDNITNQRLLEQMLHEWRMVPTLTASAGEALGVLRAAKASIRPFTLVLIDAGLPGTDGFAMASMIKEDPELAAATIVMLTSVGRPGDGARCRELGIAAYLHKPIKRAELRGAILLALATVTGDPTRAVLVTRHTLREAGLNGRILVVEDNRVNQLMARRLLEKRGYAVVTASSALEALTVLERGAAAGIGCVLLGVQRPEGDGLEFVASTRERERTAGGRVPIVAMMDDALAGNRLRCLAAGMDGCVSKPIRPDELYAIVERSLDDHRHSSSSG